MLKKIVISTLVIVLLGAVIVGAVDVYKGNSTLQLPKVSAQSNPLNRGQGQGMGQGGGQGQGQGQGRGRQDQSPQVQMIPHEWITVPGTVAAVEEQSMVVDTTDQGQLTLQLGPLGFAEQQGVTFNPGDAVTILGFEENGMFQAGEITNEITGQSLLLRDPNGRPLWAGQGQGGQPTAQALGGGGQGQGRGQGGQGRGQGQSGRGQGQGQANQPGSGNGSGVPQAMLDQEWVTLNGTVTAVAQGITVDTAEMGQIMVEIGPPWFASQQNITFNPGDTVTIVGFAGEGSMFQAGEITNDTTGTTLFLRDPNGRPLWAGRGGQGSTF